MPLAGSCVICDPTEQDLASVVRNGEVIWLYISNGAKSVGVACQDDCSITLSFLKCFDNEYDSPHQTTALHDARHAKIAVDPY